MTFKTYEELKTMADGCKSYEDVRRLEGEMNASLETRTITDRQHSLIYKRYINKLAELKEAGEI